MHNTTTNNIAHFSSELEGGEGETALLNQFCWLLCLKEWAVVPEPLLNLERLHIGQNHQPQLRYFF